MTAARPTPLRAARDAQGWSQTVAARALAGLARERGVPVASAASLKTLLSRWENGHATPEAPYRALLEELYAESGVDLTPPAPVPDTAGPVARLRARLATAAAVDAEVVALWRAQLATAQHLDDRLGARRSRRRRPGARRAARIRSAAPARPGPAPARRRAARQGLPARGHPGSGRGRPGHGRRPLHPRRRDGPGRGRRRPRRRGRGRARRCAGRRRRAAGCARRPGARPSPARPHAPAPRPRRRARRTGIRPRARDPRHARPGRRRPDGGAAVRGPGRGPPVSAGAGRAARRARPRLRRRGPRRRRRSPRAGRSGARHPDRVTPGAAPADGHRLDGQGPSAGSAESSSASAAR